MRTTTLIKILALTTTLVAPHSASAEMIRDGIWKVRDGDTLDSVLQTVLPNEKVRHERLKRLAKRLNAKSIAQDGQLVVGTSLRLPGAKMPEVAPENASKVGRVLISSGLISAKRDSGSSRALKRGDAIYEGDTIETKTGRSQVRFTDGSLVALRPNTKFKVEEYNYNGQQDGSEKGVYQLLRGGFRTISGAIGKINKSNYRVKTPVATIGIRGTHYGLTLCNQGSCKEDGLTDGLYGGVVDGSVVAQNESGETRFNNDEYFSITSIKSTPKSLLAPPGVVFGNSKQEQRSEEKKKQGTDKAANRKEKGTKHANKERLKQTPNNKQKLARNIRTIRQQANPRDRAPRRPALDPQAPTNSVHPDLLPSTTPQRVGSKAPSNARLHSAFLTNNSSNPAVQGLLQDLRVAFAMGQQSSGSSGEIGELYKTTTGTGIDILTYLGFQSNEQLPNNLGTAQINREFFAPASQNLKDIGNSRANGLNISWGRWDNAAIRSTLASGTTNASVDINPLGFHFIYSEENLASAQQLQGLHSTGLVPATVTLNPVGGTKPTDLNGNVGSILPNFTNMQLDLAGGNLNAYNIKAVFATGEHYTLHLENNTAVPLTNIIGAGNGIKLQGICDTGGACGSQINLTGNATSDFIIGSNNSINAISGYSVNNSESNATVGVAGTLLLNNGAGSVSP